MINLEERLNKAVEERQKFSLEAQSVTETLATGDLQIRGLGSNMKPSTYLPIRTARYWSDVEMGQEPIINFFKRLENGKVEIHKNATKSFWKLVDLSAFHQMLRETSFELSYKGESDVAIFKQDRTFIALKIDLIYKQYFPNETLKYYKGIVNLDTGTTPWIMTKTFYYNGKNEVIMENIPYEKVEMRDKESGELIGYEWKQMSADSFNKKYNQDIAGTKNLGKVDFPVITLTNTGADRFGSGTSDTKEVADVLANLDIVQDAYERAVKTAKARLWQKKKNGSMDLGATLETRDARVQAIMDDAEVITITEDPHSEGGDGFQITDRQLNAEQWMNVKRGYLQEYYSHTGENVAADAHGNNQHTYEVQSRGDNKYRRGTAKKTQRVQEIKTIIQAVISQAKQNNIGDFAGLDEISVSINQVDIRTIYEIEDKVQKLLDMGLISKVQAVMDIKGITEPEALHLMGIKEKHDKLFKDDENEAQNEDMSVSDEDDTENDTTDDTNDESAPAPKKGLFKRGK